MKIDWNKCRQVQANDDLIVSLSVMKNYLNIIEFNDDDGLIRELIGAATGYIEGPDGVGFVLGQKTYEAHYETLPRNARVPMAPLISVSATVAGVAVEPEWLDLATGDVRFPATPAGLTVIRMVAGHADPDEVPLNLRQAVKMLVASWYQTRENDTDKARTEVPISVDRLIQNYRRY